jgi:hypothetical protein
MNKPTAELSPRDIRYCTFCQQIIEYEYSLQSDRSHLKKYKPVAEMNSEAIESPSIEMYTGNEKTKKSTSSENTVTVDIFRPRGRPKAYRKRELPEQLIKQLHDEGLGAKAIATQLRTDGGIIVSYKTIQRILCGERKQ